MRLLVICFICSIVQIANAQKNAVFIEALGNGGKGSLNYERQLTNSPILLFRLGVGLTEDDFVDPTQLLSVASSIHYLVDLKKGNYIDVSLGLSWYDATDLGPANGMYHLFSGVGFRRNFGNNWFFRTNVSPYIWSLTKSKEIPYSGSNFGSLGGFNFPRSPKFYRYLHEDAWHGFSIGWRF